MSVYDKYTVWSDRDHLSFGVADVMCVVVCPKVEQAWRPRVLMNCGDASGGGCVAKRHPQSRDLKTTA